MRTYKSSNAIADAATAREFRAIEEAANRADPRIDLTYQSAEPKYYAGMMVLADGTNWNPGSGEGLYRRNLANTAWVLVG